MGVGGRAWFGDCLCVCVVVSVGVGVFSRHKSFGPHNRVVSFVLKDSLTYFKHMYIFWSTNAVSGFTINL